MNPFEDDSAPFLVLTNEERQYSLWPERIPVPDGWARVHSGSRRECLDHIEQTWTDLRPRSVIQAQSAQFDDGVEVAADSTAEA